MTVQALEQICNALLLILERQAADQLHGGQYFKPSNELKQSAQNVPSHNKISESDFGLFDYLSRQKPGANPEFLKAIIMFRQNKTDYWLKSKESDQVNSLMDEARKLSARMAAKYKNRREALKKRKEEKFLEEKEEKWKKEEERRSKMTKVVNQLIAVNVKAWISLNEAQDFMDTDSSENHKVQVLSAQLDYYKHIIFHGKEKTRELFSKSKGGKKHSSVELFDKFQALLDNSINSEPETTNVTVLKEKDEREMLLEQQKARLSKKVNDQRMDIHVKRT